MISDFSETFVAFYFQLINHSLLAEDTLSIDKVICFRNLILNLACNLNDEGFVQQINQRNLTKNNLVEVLGKLVAFLRVYIQGNKDAMVQNRNIPLNSQCLDLCLVVNATMKSLKESNLNIGVIDKDNLAENARCLDDLVRSVSGLEPNISSSMIFEKVGFAILDFKGEIRNWN